MRATVDSTLTDTCTIHDPANAVFNPQTGDYTNIGGPAVYDGACRFGVADSTDQRAEAGGESVRLRVYKVRLPWDTTGIQVDQIITPTASNDPHLEGRKLQVTDVRGLTDPLSRSVMVEEILG